MIRAFHSEGILCHGTGKPSGDIAARFKIANVAQPDADAAADGEDEGVTASFILEQLVLCKPSGEDATEKRFETMMRQKLQSSPKCFDFLPKHNKDPARQEEDRLAKTVSDWRRDYYEFKMTARREKFLDSICGFDWRRNHYDEVFHTNLDALREAVQLKNGNLPKSEEDKLDEMRDNAHRTLRDDCASATKRKLLREFDAFREVCAARGSRRIDEFFKKRAAQAQEESEEDIMEHAEDE